MTADAGATGKHLIERRPGPALAGLVRRLIHFRDDAPLPPMSEAADLTVPLIVAFRGRYRIGLGGLPGPDHAIGSFVAGLTAGPVRMCSAGGTECLQIDLTPPGAFRLLGRPLSGLAGALVPLDTLGDAGLSDLAARLGDCADPHRRLALAEAALTRRIAAGTGGDPRIEAAYARLVASGGALRVDAVAADLGLSRQRLSAGMRDMIGLPPKTVARIARFRAARRLAASGRASGWADLAAMAGYADQSHLVREYRSLSGIAPGPFPVRDRATFVQDRRPGGPVSGP